MYRWTVHYWRWNRMYQGFVHAWDRDSAWHLANQKYPDVRLIGLDDA